VEAISGHNHPLNVPGGCFYHHCANVAISATGADAGPNPTGDAGTGGGGAKGGCSSGSGANDLLASALRAQRAHLDPSMQLEAWDDSSKISLDKTLLNDLVSLRFLEAHNHVAIVGPVGVGKTFLAHAIGQLACRRGHTVLALRADHMLKTLKHARLDNSHEVELRKLIAVDLLIVDDFCLDAMDAQESRDAYEILTERHRSGSMIVTSNRGPDEWLATFADPMRAQSAIDRFTSNSYDLVIDGESYRRRLKPDSRTGQRKAS
jgi:DNA replication protein DnaC